MAMQSRCVPMIRVRLGRQNDAIFELDGEGGYSTRVLQANRSALKFIWGKFRGATLKPEDIRLRWLTSDGNVAETENHAPAGGKTAEAHLRPESRKQEHQIKL